MLIGLTGKIGSGKSTIANMLADREGFLIRTYAYPLKKSLAELVGCDISHFTNPELKEEPFEFGLSPRQLMQKMGDFARAIDPDFFVWRMRRSLRGISSDINVVIDDCRFENETALVRENGGIVIHLQRSYDSPTTEVSHVSEQVLKRYPYDWSIESGYGLPGYTYDTIRGILEGLDENN